MLMNLVFRDIRRTFYSFPVEQRKRERSRVRATILTDCELKFQDISDCLRRLIAPLLLRKKPVDSLSMANISHGDDDDNEDDQDYPFIFNIL